MQRITLSILTAAGLFLTSLAPSAMARPERVKLATLAPKGTSYHKALMRMRQTWKKSKVKVIIYPDGQMGGESDMVRRMRIGQIQMALMTASGLAEIDSSITALQNMPMTFRTFDEVEYVRNQLRPEIEEKFRKKGFIILALEDTGWVKFFTRSRVATPKDLSHLKLFALSNDVQAVQLWKSAGFNPVPLDTTAMLTGLKTGMIDAIPSPPYYALATQSYTAAPFMLDINWAPLVGGIIITKKAWDKLPASEHARLREAAAAAGKEVRTAGRAKNTESVDTMKSRGLTVVSPTTQENAQWESTVAGVTKDIRGKLVSAELYDKVQNLLEAYRQKKTAN